MSRLAYRNSRDSAPLAEPAADAAEMASDERRRPRPGVVLGLAVAVGLALKAWLILGIPVVSIAPDEFHHYTTGYDFLHLGEPGVPHPNFLRYPPLTALVTSPVHLLDLEPPWPYWLARVVLNVFLMSTVVAGYLIFRRLFGHGSAFLVLALLLSAPAYLGLGLLSEPLFVTGYTWYLFFYVRFLDRRSRRDAVAAGLMIAAMILARPTGLGMLGVVLVGFLAEAWLRWRRRHEAANLHAHLYILLVPVVVYGGWELTRHWAFAEYGKTAALVELYVKRGVLDVVFSWPELELFLRKTAANLSYVSLATWGLALPLGLWALLDRRHDSPRHRRVKLYLVNLGAFSLVASLIAAAHMYAFRDRVVPRYDLFGRYVDYFTVPLLIVVVGLLGWVHRDAAVRKWKLFATAAVAAIACLAIIPRRLFTSFAAAGDDKLIVNHRGIGWLIELNDRAGPWLLPAAAVVLLGVSAAFLSPLYGRSRAFRRGAQVALLGLFAINAAVAFEYSQRRSQKILENSNGLSEYMSEHPELLASGFYLHSNFRYRFLPFPVLLATFDHVDGMVGGRSPKPYLGRIPVLSYKKFRDYEVLYAVEGPRKGRTKPRFRLYGTAPRARKAAADAPPTPRPGSSP